MVNLSDISVTEVINCYIIIQRRPYEQCIQKDLNMFRLHNSYAIQETHADFLTKFRRYLMFNLKKNDSTEYAKNGNGWHLACLKGVVT